MVEEKMQKTDSPKDAGEVVARAVFGDRKKGPRPPRSGDRRFEKRDEYEQRMLEVARVTRVMSGGKRMSFRACIALGDKKGTIGLGLGKGADVTLAVNKAVNKAKKNMMTVPLINDTIPHEVYQRLGASKIFLKPSKKGRGVIAGGVVRVVLELAGVKNITSKILGGKNKINNARCTLLALSKLRKVEAPKKEGDKAPLKKPFIPKGKEAPKKPLAKK